MRKVFRWVCVKFGLKMWYYITATYPTAGGYATISCTCSVAPWLHNDNFSELVEYIKTQANSNTVTPNIVNITRLWV